MTVVLVITTFVAILYMVRFYRLRANLRREAKELKEIGQNPEENRILHISFPDKEAESFLEAVNAYILVTRKEKIIYRNRERELRAQIDNISHDLRTPLTAIIGYLELLDVSGMDEENLEMVKNISGKARSLQRLIGNFYDLSRLELNDYRLQPERLDVSRFAREIALTFYQQFEERELSVQLADISAEAMFICADMGAMERIFSNMFQNALRYAKSYFCLRVFRDGGKVCLSFENDTDALRAEDVEHLFERFYMTQKSRTTEGSGLGLTISKLLTEAMGGSAEASLEQGVLRIRYCFEEV